MKPRPFDYYAPRALDEALSLLATHGSRAKALAGGQTLVQRMNMREVSPQVIVDLNRLPELDSLRMETGGALAIGAMVRQQRLVTADEIRSANPALTATARMVAFPAVRSRGTLGGSVANGEPGAQLPLLLAVLDAQATIARMGGWRTTWVSSLFAPGGGTTLAPEELIIELSVPPLSATAGYAIKEFRRGHSGPPLVTVVSVIELSGGVIASARLGVSGARDVPLRLREEEALLTGQAPSFATFAEAARQVAGVVEMGDPVLADVGLRRRATRALVERALAESASLAAQRAGKEEAPR